MNGFTLFRVEFTLFRERFADCPLIARELRVEAEIVVEPGGLRKAWFRVEFSLFRLEFILFRVEFSLLIARELR